MSAYRDHLLAELAKTFGLDECEECAVGRHIACGYNHDWDGGDPAPCFCQCEGIARDEVEEARILEQRRRYEEDVAAGRGRRWGSTCDNWVNVS